MTKPFPCCCQCVYCPQYGSTNDWTFDISGLATAFAGPAFTSSTTGNPLHVDLNNLLHPPFNLTGSAGSYSWANTDLFPGKSWVYGSFTVTEVGIELTVGDFCGKVWLSQANIRGRVNGGSLGTIANLPGAGSAPASNNCGSPINRAGFISSYMQSGSITLTPP